MNNTVVAHSPDSWQPDWVPLTIDQYELLVDAGSFDRTTGQIELIRGRILSMNPQGPQHSDPIDVLTEWSIESVRRRYTVKIEKPIRLPELNSCPEPDIAWVARQRYHRRHPGPEDVHLLIEVSYSSSSFDQNDKKQLYAEAKIPEYWQVDIPTRTITMFRRPVGINFEFEKRFGLTDTISPGCLPEATLDVAKLFVE